MSRIPTSEGRPPRRPFRLRGPASRAALAAAFAVAAVLAFAFAWQSGIPTIGDDSVTYVTLARFFAGLDAPWAAQFTWFPPLFPLLVAAVGGASRLENAHALVAASGVLALPLIHRHAARCLGRRDAALLVAVLFELTATAWIGIKGILSEPTFLLFSMAALVFFDSRLFARGRARDRWMFGLLLAAAALTRVAGFFLVAAYGIREAIACAREGRRPQARDFVALVPPVALTLLWWALRPMAGRDVYGWASEGFVQGWLAHGGEVFLPALHSFFQGWIASFTGDADAGAMPSFVLGGLGFFALAGTWARLRRNRLDGWYVAITLLAVAALFFGENAARRYLYPVIPLLLVNAGIAFAALARRFPPRTAPAVVALLVAAPTVACLPDSVLLARKALDRRVVLEGFPIRYCDITDYYTTLDLSRSRALAAKQAAVISGLRAISSVTPTGAKTMWVRPEYVSLLSGRSAEPWFYRWDDVTLARNIAASGVGYVVISGLFKADLSFTAGNPARIHAAVRRFARPVLVIPNAVVPAEEFVLMRVDPDALSAFVAAASR